MATKSNIVQPKQDGSHSNSLATNKQALKNLGIGYIDLI